MDVYLTYDEHREGGVAEDPSDRWTSYTDEYIHFYPRQLFSVRASAGVFVETLYEQEHEVLQAAQSGDTVYLLVVRYQSGSTFGTSHGNWTIEGVYASPEDAALVASHIEDDAKAEDQRRFERRGTHQSYKVKYTGYKAWEGYFERLESTEITPMTIR